MFIQLIELYADSRCPTRATRSDLAAAFSNLLQVMNRATTDVGASSLFPEIALLAPATMTAKGAAP